MTKERIQKVLARAGVASRREVERMIRQGRVKLNGKILGELGVLIDGAKDLILIDDKPVLAELDAEPEHVYLLVNKPAGVVSTTKDEHQRKCVLDLVSGARKGRIYPVGRLDYDSEGALLLTNDGELTNELLHPSNHVKKVYMVKVKGVPKKEQLDKLRRGIYLEDGPTGSCEIEVVSKARVNTWVRVTLTKGKNQQIKRMFWRIDHPVAKLIRTHFAGISIDGLPTGRFRSLSKKEIAQIKGLI